jgi:hypothetical protein
MANAVFVIPFDGTGISADAHGIFLSIRIAPQGRPAVSNAQAANVTNEALGSTKGS